MPPPDADIRHYAMTLRCHLFVTLSPLLFIERLRFGVTMLILRYGMLTMLRRQMPLLR